MAGFEVIGEEEFLEIKDIFNNGGVMFRHGFENIRNNTYKVADFEKQFASCMGVDSALAVSSGTAALRVALAALGIGAGDEVITQTFTFVATVEAIVEAGATPVCVDIDETLNICPNSLEGMITSKTKAVIAVHMLGGPARIEEIKIICDRHGLALIEDTAWGCGGTLNNKSLGTFGDIGTYSFDFAKTMTTGEGGMLVFKEKAVADKAAAWHDHGHENNPNVPRWEDTRSSSGFNYRMMELQGALGLAQLRKLPSVVEAQRLSRDLMWDTLKHLTNVKSRAFPDGANDTADALVLFVPNAECARNCRKNLNMNGLSTKILPEAISWHFAGTWSHISSLVNRHDGDLSMCFQKSKDLLSRAIALPVSVQQPNQEQLNAIRKSIEGALGELRG